MIEEYLEEVIRIRIKIISEKEEGQFSLRLESLKSGRE